MCEKKGAVDCTLEDIRLLVNNSKNDFSLTINFPESSTEEEDDG